MEESILINLESEALWSSWNIKLSTYICTIVMDIMFVYCLQQSVNIQLPRHLFLDTKNNLDVFTQQNSECPWTS